MTAARLKYFGWGREGEGMSADERDFVLGRYHEKFGAKASRAWPFHALDELALPAPRVAPPASLAAFCTTERYDRAAHAYGKSYPDYVRAMLGQYDCAPDVVAYPRNEAEISARHGLGRRHRRVARAVRRRVERLRRRRASPRRTRTRRAVTRRSANISAGCGRSTRRRARRGSRAARSGRRWKRN